MQKLTDLLTKTGAFFEDRRQSMLYLALLRLGTSGIESLHKETGIHRETIQRELRKMERRGTITITQKGRNKKIQAVPISKLQENLEHTKEKFEFLLKPLLEAEAESQQPKVNVFMGSQAFGLLQIRLLKIQPKGQPIYVTSANPKAWREAMVDSGKLEQFERERIVKKVTFWLSCFESVRGEVEYNNRAIFVNQPPELKRKYRYIKTADYTPLTIQIWQNHVCLSIFSADPAVHIVFEDKTINHAMKSYFNILWRIGTP